PSGMRVTSRRRSSRSSPPPDWKSCSDPSETSPPRRIRRPWQGWPAAITATWTSQAHCPSSNGTASCSNVRAMDGGGGDTPEELETLLEDAFLLRDADAVARLFEESSLLVTGEGSQQMRGRTAILRAASLLCHHG